MPHSDIRRRQNQGLAVIDMHVPRNTRLAGVEALDRMVNGEPPELPDEATLTTMKIQRMICKLLKPFVLSFCFKLILG